MPMPREPVHGIQFAPPSVEYSGVAIKRLLILSKISTLSALNVPLLLVTVTVYSIHSPATTDTGPALTMARSTSTLRGVSIVCVLFSRSGSGVVALTEAVFGMGSTLGSGLASTTVPRIRNSKEAPFARSGMFNVPVQGDVQRPPPSTEYSAPEIMAGSIISPMVRVTASLGPSFSMEITYSIGPPMETGAIVCSLVRIRSADCSTVVITVELLFDRFGSGVSLSTVPVFSRVPVRAASTSPRMRM